MTKYELMIEMQDIEEVRKHNHSKYLLGDRDFNTFIKVLNNAKVREEKLIEKINELED